MQMSEVFSILLKCTNDHSYNFYRELQNKQRQHVHRVCSDKPSYVIARWSSDSPCASSFSNIKQMCLSTGVLQMRQSRTGQLVVGCNEDIVNVSSKCTTERVDMHMGYYWYFSTKVLSVVDIHADHICRISLESRLIQEYELQLVYLNVIVCSSNNETQHLTSMTDDSFYHEKLEFPIIYNPSPIAQCHPKPFWISRIGLYLDELGRLSIQISTSKENMAKEAAAAESVITISV